jgi:hypothetical protein
MGIRWSVGYGTAFLSVSVAALQSAPHRVAFASSPPPLILDLQLTATRELAPLTRLALIAEAESIWDEAYVRLRWFDRYAEADGRPFLRVIVMPRGLPRPGEQSPWKVGELLRQDGTQSIAIASITGARRIIDESRRFRAPDLPAMYDRRMGVVLGRAVAHEIGHYLLQTNTHATNGLMRARIDVHELADWRSATFRLDKAAEAHLAAIAATGTLSAKRSAFSYESR